MICERCRGPHDHVTETCCSSHEKRLCHACYRRTHFVEVCNCALCVPDDERPQPMDATPYLSGNTFYSVSEPLTDEPAVRKVALLERAVARQRQLPSRFRLCLSACATSQWPC